VWLDTFQEVLMIKSKKKLHVAREVLVTLSKAKLEAVAGGFVTVAGAKCEPSGIRACDGE
jgi:hypothetical protein